MIFRDNTHEDMYNVLCGKMRYLDEYHKALAYLFALDTVVRKHVSDVFDFAEDLIVREGLNKGWQTGTSMRTTRLAFNLWNGCCSDGEVYTDKNGYEADLPSSYYTPENIFCCEYAPYYWQAIKLRYPNFCD